MTSKTKKTDTSSKLLGVTIDEDGRYVMEVRLGRGHREKWAYIRDGRSIVMVDREEL